MTLWIIRIYTINGEIIDLSLLSIYTSMHPLKNEKIKILGNNLSVSVRSFILLLRLLVAVVLWGAFFLLLKPRATLFNYFRYQWHSCLLAIVIVFVVRLSFFNTPLSR